MPGTTAKGYPYAQGGDAAATIDDTMLALAQKVDARPGVSPLTTVERDALAGADLWDGRVIWNKTTVQLERYILGTNTWVAAVNTVVLDYGEAADITTSLPGDAPAAGASGEIADAAHRHGREAAPTLASLGAASAASFAELRLQQIMSSGRPAPSLRRAGPVVAGNVLTVAAGRKYVIKSIILDNQHPTNDTAAVLQITGVANIVNTTVVKASKAITLDVSIVLNAGEALTIAGASIAATVAYIDLAAAELPTRYYQGLSAGTSSAWADLFTATEDRVLTCITLTNLSGAALSTAHRIGAAGTAVLDGGFVLAAGESVVIDTPLFVPNGVKLQLWTNAANGLGITVSGYPAQS